jgi:ABC-type methionine transport system permease subunit
MRVRAKKNTVRKLTSYAKAAAGVVSTIAMAVEVVDKVKEWFEKPQVREVTEKVTTQTHQHRHWSFLVMMVVLVPVSVWLVHYLGYHLEKRAED